jgi:hypothetical protein
MKTIAQKLKITEFPFVIKDKNNNEIYFETSKGYWYKQEFDSNNNRIYYENSDGHWGRYKYDSNNNEIYYENSNGHWIKQEYDSNNNEIYYENSDGIIDDNRPKLTPEYTMEELVKKLGFEFKIKK